MDDELRRDVRAFWEQMWAMGRGQAPMFPKQVDLIKGIEAERKRKSARVDAETKRRHAWEALREKWDGRDDR